MITFSGLMTSFLVSRHHINWSGNVIPSEDLCTSETNMKGGYESENPELKGQ